MEIGQTFENLDANKQKRIVDAALKEFAENGFEKGSTNQIVKNAGIGKGMLFYYFNNKKEIYLYLIDYAMNIMTKEFFSLIDTTEPDFIERLKQIARVKTKYYNENPDVSNFIATVFLNDEMEIPENMEKRLADLQKSGNSMLYDNIDPTLFRDDIDVDKAFKLIRWSIEGYQNELMNHFKGQQIASIDLDPYWTEFYDYLDVLKTCFYKK
ncbi:TetR/AcrR family transcriptional regulator [Halobacillus naozhouensis]|uniref:TetR/AcrR family transcriptional regulator n=1 Tax=Halobacillus naozhouensis TaxID=554880 RepID=A0ABY8IXN5_9BACI|nr:TetR/AcrR family transcriptional regulator [Halobacillus naozhouensis]WFT74059.1 TetR/AcrR family transcriptional regulator [Halobacillus naozhouensis]